MHSAGCGAAAAQPWRLHRSWRIRSSCAASSKAASRIAAVFGSIDDLIENNRRRVEVLEEMARAIYREWFVKFRYPGHGDVPMVDSALGPIPRGGRRHDR